MEKEIKPVITIYTRGNDHIYRCKIVDESYGQKINNIETILYVLKMMYYLEKDKNGQYKHAN